MCLGDLHTGLWVDVDLASESSPQGTLQCKGEQGPAHVEESAGSTASQGTGTGGEDARKRSPSFLVRMGEGKLIWVFLHQSISHLSVILSINLSLHLYKSIVHQ